MEIGIPQAIWLCLTLLGAGISVAKHGQRRVGVIDAYNNTIVTCLVAGLLYWGGFFG